MNDQPNILFGTVSEAVIQEDRFHERRFYPINPAPQPYIDRAKLALWIAAAVLNGLAWWGIITVIRWLL